LHRWQRHGLALFAAVIVLFGGLVVLRSAFLTQRMGDVGVFLRTAWAVRSGADIYQITDDNGHHYHYPPLLAILLVPLADPPAGADPSGMIPYALAVAIWYAFSVACLWLGVHALASALEHVAAQTGRQAPRRGSSRWWGLRLLPILACLPAVGGALMRGQVDMLLLALLCGAMASSLRGRSGWAGFLLAGAICVKVIPAFLLIEPLSRRDGRCLAGCLLGLALGLVIVPAAAFGPERTLTSYKEWTHVLIGPALGAGDDQSRAKELIEVTATDSQSLQATLHNTLYPDPQTRPPHPAPAVRAVHWLGGGLLTAITLCVARGRRDDGPAAVITFGALLIVMVLLSPVCHLHYFSLAIPLVLGVQAAAYDGGETSGWQRTRWVVAAVNVVANILPRCPGMQPLRDGGLAMYATLLLWLVGLLVISTRSRKQSVEQRKVCGLAA
jgi:hypothetical protein